MTTQYKPGRIIFPLSLITLCIHSAYAGDYFDPGLLAIGQENVTLVDLSRFEKSGSLAPGIYNLNIFINGDEYGYRDIEAVATDNGVIPVVTPALLKELGVNVDGISALRNRPADDKITNLSTFIPQATVRIELKTLTLQIRVPQANMNLAAAGAVNPELLDVGIPGLMLNYNANASRMWSRDGSPNSNLFSGINGGININAWRLRTNYIYNHSEGGRYRYSHSDFNSTRLTRTLVPMKAELAIGEINTSADVFDSFPARAVTLSSLEQMKPYSMRGFAPIITGNAETNARVTVLQNNNIVYQTYVSPGPFAINDLYQTAIGADLTVMIHEADGRVRTQKIAYSSLPNMQRQGAWRYQFAAGKYNNHNDASSDAARFMQGTVSYGLPLDITLYGGLMAAEKYYSGVLGLGMSMGNFGALSADVTHSTLNSTRDEGRFSGQSYRLRYSKSIMETGTSVDLTAYRYSTQNYYSFTDYNRREYHPGPDDYPWAMQRRRSSFQTRLTQDFSEYGMFSLSASRDDYWGSQAVNKNLSANYNVTVQGITLGAGYSIDRIKRNGNWPENRSLYLNVQVPFNIFNREDTAYVNYMMSNDNHGRVQQQASYNGTLLDSHLSYSAQQSWSNGKNDPATSGLNLSYQGSKGLASLGYSQSSRWKSLNASLNGGLVAHSGGITLSQTLGSSVALVHAPGAINTSVLNGNVKTDSAGYAVVPYLSDFQKNAVILDPSSLPDNVELQKNTLNVYPIKDAIVRADFATRTGAQAIFSLEDLQGNPLPFGAMVFLEGDTGKGDTMFIVGDKGQAYITGLPPKGILHVKWGDNQTQACQASYRLTDINSKQGIFSQPLVCR